MAHEDFTWARPWPQQDRRRCDRVEAFATKLLTLFESGLEVELLNVMGSEDQVITMQRNTASADHAGLDIDVLNLFTITDGKLAEMQTFPGDQYALDAFWGESSAVGSSCESSPCVPGSLHRANDYRAVGPAVHGSDPIADALMNSPPWQPGRCRRAGTAMYHARRM